MTNTSCRAAIHARVADDIRRLAPALTAISQEAALKNWEYFFQQGRYTLAKHWWAVAMAQ